MKAFPIQTGSIPLHPPLCLNLSVGTTLNPQLAQYHRKNEMSLSSMKPKCCASQGNPGKIFPIFFLEKENTILKERKKILASKTPPSPVNEQMS